MSDLQLAILGGGHMGRALVAGLLRSGTRPERIGIGESSEEARRVLASELGVTATPDNARAVDGAAVVVVAVRPQDTGPALEGLRPLLQAQHPLVLSIAAGVRVATLEAWCGEGVAVMRAMPNRAALVGAGATALYAPPTVSAAQRAAAEHIARGVGGLVWVNEEDHLDVVTALSGSGPAYFFLLAECMAEAAEGLGLAPPVARILAAATLHGAGVLAHSGVTDLARLRAEIASPGGTTEAALEVLTSGRLREVVERAMAAAARRSHELGTQAARRPASGSP
ncbi:MAG TPA: pyrroline-5-carboxylate reductase [Steroidobacteraceae bacterium]|nr:pyrroline-5-carboxylate reductase [Steroidobacteraceae bacterium]